MGFTREAECNDANTARKKAKDQAAARSSSRPSITSHKVISPKLKDMFGKKDNSYQKGYYGPFSLFNS